MKKAILLGIILIFACDGLIKSELIRGCTLASACNYVPGTTEDDGSCLEFDCADVCGGNSYLDDCGVCDTDLTNDCLPDGHSYNSSTLQAFYFFNSVTLDGVPIASDDLVIAYKGQVCVGSRQWDVSSCGGGLCDVPVMGYDGSENTQGYMQTGGVPSFSVYENSSGTYYLAFPSEPVDAWSISGFSMNDSLKAFSQ